MNIYTVITAIRIIAYFIVRFEDHNEYIDIQMSDLYVFA